MNKLGKRIIQAEAAARGPRVKQPPLERLACVSLYIDGWRDVVILSHGHKWLKGFEAATLKLCTLPADEPYKDDLHYARTRLLKRLRANAKTYEPTETVKEAIAELGRLKSKEDDTWLG